MDRRKDARAVVARGAMLAVSPAAPPGRGMRTAAVQDAVRMPAEPDALPAEPRAARRRYAAREPRAGEVPRVALVRHAARARRAAQRRPAVLRLYGVVRQRWSSRLQRRGL
jgi:hypothetical protein